MKRYIAAFAALALVIFAAARDACAPSSPHKRYGEIITTQTAGVQLGIVVPITPPSTSGNVNDYNPTGLAANVVIRMSCSASCTLTGVLAQANGTEITVQNVGTNPINIAGSNSNSLAADRILTPGNATLVLDSTSSGGSDTIRMYYDNTLTKWICMVPGGRNIPSLVVPAGGLTVQNGGGIVSSGTVQVAAAGNAFQLIQQSGTAVAPFVQAFSGTPVGTVTSTHQGDVIVDTTTPAVWFATAASATTWRRDVIYLGRQTLTAASGTYTPNANARGAVVRMCGGGGGGGTNAGPGNVSVGGGGASGAWIEFHVGFAGSLLTGGAFTNGAAGTAGASTPTAGGVGGNSTLVIAGVTATAKGGNGGGAGTNGAAPQLTVGGTVQTGSGLSAGSIDYTGGTQGGSGIAWSNSSSLQQGGGGGSSPYGVGGIGNTLGAGNAATGNCAGGSSGASDNSSAAGGAGTIGIIIVDEYD